MLYQALRAAADAALHWYYADRVVQGRERIPLRGPLLVVSNHPNALVDALVVATAVPQRVLLTAKATLFEHPLLAPLLQAVGVVPLRRMKDELSAAKGARVSAERNTDSFRAVTEALRRGGTVLVFPEGISHDQPALAPLKTGAARMALAARDAGVPGIRVLPIGLIFEHKERPRSRILLRVGQPIELDAWTTRSGTSDAARLTGDLELALRQVTLNFATELRAERAVGLARILTAIAEAPAPLGRPRSLVTEAQLARRIEIATERLSAAPLAVAQWADAFIGRAEALESQLQSEGIALADVRISPRLHHGARFAVREGALAVLATPIAFVGRLGHWLPLRLARTLAIRPLATDPSRDQPAMRTIVLGLAFVLLWYVLIAFGLAHQWGAVAAVLGVAGLFLAAQIDLSLRERVLRARRRARTYLALRRDPVRRDAILAELQALLADAAALEQALVTTPAADSAAPP